MSKDAEMSTLATAPGFFIGVTIPCFAGCKNCFQSEVILLADRVIFVRVTVGTAHSSPSMDSLKVVT
jgi:hypothetical protein